MARVAKSGVNESQPASAGTGSALIKWFFQPAMLFRMSLVAGVCALWPYAAQKLPSLGARSEYQISTSKIQITPLPDGPVPQNLVEQVIELGKLPREFSVLSDEITARVANSFREHPWVARVIRVKKSFPATITVELEYRRPVAMVEIHGGRIPIDIHGIILPSMDFSANDSNRFPLIQRVDSKPKARAGDVWAEPTILAAARLANLLAEKWKPLKLEAIVVPRITDASMDPNEIPLELIGRGGSRIVWGRGPDTDHPGELESSQKIRRLEKYLIDFGDYLLPNGPYEIDIRHWQEISRRPLADKIQPKQAKAFKSESKIRHEFGGVKQEAKFQRPERRR